MRKTHRLPLHMESYLVEVEVTDEEVQECNILSVSTLEDGSNSAISASFRLSTVCPYIYNLQ